jgi:hypothetical protein
MRKILDPLVKCFSKGHDLLFEATNVITDPQENKVYLEKLKYF